VLLGKGGVLERMRDFAAANYVIRYTGNGTILEKAAVEDAPRRTGTR